MNQPEPEEMNPARLQILGQLESVDEALRFFTHRKGQLESILLDVKAEESAKFPNSFTFGKPPDGDEGLWRLLKDKILRASEKVRAKP